jgi:hypothetical protein
LKWEPKKTFSLPIRNKKGNLSFYLFRKSGHLTTGSTYKPDFK